MLLLHIPYSEKDAAAHIQLAFGQYSHTACLYVFEIHRKKSHPSPLAELSRICFFPTRTFLVAAVAQG